MLVAVQIHILSFGIDLVPPVFFVPLRHSRILVDVLDDFAPANSCVVGAEADFPLLRRVRDNAHFRAAEVVIEQILKPHSRNEKNVPPITSPLRHILVGSVGADTPIEFPGAAGSGNAHGHVELFVDVPERKRRRSLQRVVVLQNRENHAENGDMPVPTRVRDFSQIGHKSRNVDEARNRRPLLGLPVDYQRRPHAAVRMAAARECAPLRLRAVNQVCKVGEGTDRRNGKPVLHWLDVAQLLAHVLCQV